MINVPEFSKNEMKKRVDELTNPEAIDCERRHGILVHENIIILDMNHNRQFLMDALDVPLKLFEARLKHPRKGYHRVTCRSLVKHQLFNISSKSPKGMPSKNACNQFNQIRKLGDKFPTSWTCKIKDSDAGALYYLSGQLDNSIGRKMFNDQDWNELRILRNGLARIFMKNKV